MEVVDKEVKRLAAKQGSTATAALGRVDEVLKLCKAARAELSAAARDDDAMAVEGDQPRNDMDTEQFSSVQEVMFKLACDVKAYGAAKKVLAAARPSVAQVF